MTEKVKCKKPGCCEKVEPPDEFCGDCYYPGIDSDYNQFRAYRQDGYGVYQSMLAVGWADPPEGE